MASTEYASAMDSIFPQTWFGTQFKHAKGVEIVMGDIDSLSSYPNDWKSCLVPHLLIGKIDSPAQLAQGWDFHQAVFCHSDLGGRTKGKHSLLLLTPPTMILHPCPYIKIPNQPWNHMLASVNPVNSAVPKSQPDILIIHKLGCMDQCPRCGHMDYSLQYTREKCWVYVQTSLSLNRISVFGIFQGLVWGIISGHCTLWNDIARETWCG